MDVESGLTGGDVGDAEDLEGFEEGGEGDLEGDGLGFVVVFIIVVVIARGCRRREVGGVAGEEVLVPVGSALHDAGVVGAETEALGGDFDVDFVGEADGFEELVERARGAGDCPEQWRAGVLSGL